MRTLVIFTVSLTMFGLALSEGTTSFQQMKTGGFFATLNGFRIHYEVRGNGPTLMVVPNSWGFTIEGLRKVYGGLEDNLTLVYFDPRGMGLSDSAEKNSDRGPAAVREDFLALMDHLELTQSSAIGWSNGAMNLLVLASENPTRFSRAIFLHGAAKYDKEDAEKFAAEYPDLVQSYAEFMKQLADSTVPDSEKNARLKALWLNEYFPLACADRREAKKLLQDAFGNLSFSWKHVMATNQEMGSFDLRDDLSKISARSLIIAGDHDTLPAESAREMHAGIPDSELAVFSESGHFASLEEPGKFHKIVLEFLNIE